VSITNGIEEKDWRGMIALALVIGIIILYYFGKAPDALLSAILSIVAFYFGSKTAERKKIKMERN
jgi:hypothetical protein